MDYIVCQEPGKFQLLQKPSPKPLPGEALVRIRKVGICGTDLHAYAGNQPFFSYPRILGHELAAEVLEINAPDPGFKAGDQVAIMPYVGCKKCYACRNGKSNCCTQLRVLGVHTDGGMQQEFCLPADQLISAGGLTLNETALLEPLAIGAHAIRRAQLKPGEVALVLGCGPIGLGIAAQARAMGARVLIMDVNNSRLEAAQKGFGINDIFRAGDQAIHQITEITSGDMAAVVFDATGNKKALESGPEYMAHGGRFVLVGLYRGTLSYDHPSLHSKETSLLCSRNATLEDFDKVSELLRSGSFPSASYISSELSYEEMIAQFDSWLSPESGLIKTIINF